VTAPTHVGLGETTVLTIRVANLSSVPLDSVKVCVILGHRLVPQTALDYASKEEANGETYYTMTLPLTVPAQSSAGFSFKIKLHPACELFEVFTWRYFLFPFLF
jgi:hypothetical protein